MTPEGTARAASAKPRHKQAIPTGAKSGIVILDIWLEHKAVLESMYTQTETDRLINILDKQQARH